MAFELSRARKAVQEADLEALQAALSARTPSPSVLMGCASDVFERPYPGFAKKALALLVAHGLDPNAVPPVSPHARFSDRLPDAVAGTLRLMPMGSFGFDDVGLPLASRAALVDAGLLEVLLDAGADPQVGGQFARSGTDSALMFGSAWASALALSGSPLGDQGLEVLLRRDPRPWSVDSGMVVDALRALVHPSHSSAPFAWSVDMAQKAWEVVDARMPSLSRDEWASVWDKAVGWTMLNIQSPARRRLVVLIEALPGPALAGLFDASRKRGWDLRGLAQGEDLDGNPGPWNALEKHWQVLGCDQYPQWGELKINQLQPDGTSHVTTVPLDGLGHLLLKTRWPSPSPAVFERADAWLERLAPSAQWQVAGKTLGQWAVASPKITGAPLEWQARDDRWWTPHPDTGRTPLHECQNLAPIRRSPQALAGRLDWSALDSQGNEAGTTALALATLSDKGIASAIAALDADVLRAAGQCAGRPASAWVAFHPGLRQAYDASCARHQIQGPRRNRSAWRLHAAAEAMSPSRVRQCLLALPSSQRVEALTQVDPMGRTPLLWWAMAKTAVNKDGQPSKAWTSRAQVVFDLLTAYNAPLWVPGMECHPFSLFLGKDLDSDREGRPKSALMSLAADFGRQLSDPDFRQKAWDRLVKDWSWGATNASTAQVWKTWALSPDSCKELLETAWAHWTSDPNPNLVSGRVFGATIRTIQLWSEAGAAVGPSDLATPQLLSAFERLAAVFPGPALELRASPVLGAALTAAELDRALKPSPPAEASDGSRPRLRF